MEKIKSDFLELGMKFSEPVFFDDEKNMFLPEKKPIRKFHLDTLKRWNIPFVVTHGHLLASASIELDALLGMQDGANASSSAKALSELDEVNATNASDESELEELEELEEVTADLDSNASDVTVGRLEENPLFIQYNDLVCSVSMLFEKLRAQTPSNCSEQLQEIVGSLFSLATQNPSFVSSFLLAGEVKKQDFATSAVNSAIVTFLVSKQLNLINKKIIVYMTGALLHDIGMLHQPDTIIYKREPLNAEEITRIKLHSMEGSRMASAFFQVTTDVMQIIMQHHEHWDGLGYPYGLKGPAICEGAQIVAVTDAFEAMITEKSYRSSMLGYTAMKALISDNGRHFSPDVIRAFVQSMGVYPIGSLVLLNDGAIARVKEGNSTTPLRPVIRLIVSSNGVKFDANRGPIINLEMQKSLFIVRAIDGKDLRGKIN